jgi:hypothetical protein
MHNGAKVRELFDAQRAAHACNGPGTSIKYLRRTTSGAAVNGLSRCQGLLKRSFTTIALHTSCFVRVSFASKLNSTFEGRDLFSQ